MKILDVKSLAIPDVKVVRFGRFPDARGYFTEPFRKSDFFGCPGLESLRGIEFVQVNESYSHANVLRGLHFQWNPFMGKLVRAVAGHLVDLALDIRQGSPTAGKIIAYDMPSRHGDTSAEWIWVPPGFAHGTLLLEPTYLEYYCTGEYSPGCEAAISPLAHDLDWSLCDPRLKAAFDRVVATGAIVSEKDRHGVTLAQWNADPRAAEFVYGKC
jgi:dTDP-4-dehydrorhamnose 3,5-epimerase